MAATNMNLTGIARKLVMDNHMDEATALEAVEAANKENVQLTSYLVQNKIVPSNVIAMISSQEFGLPVFDKEFAIIRTCQRFLSNPLGSFQAQTGRFNEIGSRKGHVHFLCSRLLRRTRVRLRSRTDKPLMSNIGALRPFYIRKAGKST